MPNNLSNFAMSADDVARAKNFYAKTFGWQFTPWGPPDFYVIQTGPDNDRGLHGTLQMRDETAKGKPRNGFRCTIGVDSIDDTIAAVERNGGKIVMPKFEIPNVGTLIYFEDTEGTVVGAMQYDPNYKQ